jgi:hypothetical protein
MSSTGTMPVTYQPRPGGGVTVVFEPPGERLMLPMDRTTALEMAAGILHATGITQASFADGLLIIPPGE